MDNNPNEVSLRDFDGVDNVAGRMVRAVAFAAQLAAVDVDGLTFEVDPETDDVRITIPGRIGNLP